MDFQKFENEVAVTVPPTNGDPFMLIKSKPADISPALKDKFLMLGILQIINGSLLFIFNITGIFVGTSITMYIGPGIWVGIFVVVSGAFGVLIHRKTSRGFVITFLVLSIISSVIVWCVIGMAIPGIVDDSRPYYYNYYNTDAQIAINSVLLIIGVVGMVTAIVASAFGCGVVCCNSEPTRYIPVRMDMHTNKLVFENTPPPAYVINQQY